MQDKHDFWISFEKIVNNKEIYDDIKQLKKTHT